MGKKVTIEWRESARRLTAADIDHLENLLAILIARVIYDEATAKENGDKTGALSQTTGD